MPSSPETCRQPRNCQAYLQSMQSNWLSYVQNQQQMQNSNYWNQQQMQANQQQINAEQTATAYNRALQMLGMGIMPGTDLLSQANLSQQEAEAIRASVLAELGGASGSTGRSGPLRPREFPAPPAAGRMITAA